MTSISSIYPYVLPELPGIPTPVVDRVVLSSIREFYRRSQLYRNTETLDVVASVASFTLLPPAGNELLKVHSVTYDGNIVPLYTEASGIIKLKDTDEGETIVYYTWDSGSNITVYPIPNFSSTAKLKVQYSYQPLQSATDIFADVFERWVECIAAKVKSELMMQSRVSWSNPSIGMYNRGEYWRLLGDARSEANRIYGNPVSAAVYSLDQG